jgi:hypothetical protein
VYTPTCAQIRTRRKIVRIEEQEEVCKPKWVVQYLCEGCAASCATSAAPVAPQPLGVLSSLFGGKEE